LEIPFLRLKEKTLRDLLDRNAKEMNSAHFKLLESIKDADYAAYEKRYSANR
jgi:hypothetical protein